MNLKFLFMSFDLPCRFMIFRVFDLYKEGKEMYCIDESVLKMIPSDSMSCDFKVEGRRHTVMLEVVKVGYGDRRYFVCPCCGKKRTILYYINHGFKCRDCGHFNPYKKIQNGTKGGSSEIQYRMERYAKKNNIEIVRFPFNYMDYIQDERLMKKGKNSFRMKLKVLQALENMRFQTIMMKKTFSNQAIRKVISEKHPILQKVSLKDMTMIWYDWESDSGKGFTIPASHNRVSQLTKDAMKGI